MDTFDWRINIYWFDTLLPIAAKYEIYRKLFHTKALYGTTMILKSELHDPKTEGIRSFD